MSSSSLSFFLFFSLARLISDQMTFVALFAVFSFPAGYQNVYLMSSKSAHESCDFSQATELDAGNAGTYAVSDFMSFAIQQSMQLLFKMCVIFSIIA